jgi:hypothetical protein
VNIGAMAFQFKYHRAANRAIGELSSNNRYSKLNQHSFIHECAGFSCGFASPSGGLHIDSNTINVTNGLVNRMLT